MSTQNRNFTKWTIPEILQLQREYELLEWTIQEIALKHQRSEKAIHFKLLSEGFIGSWMEARGYELAINGRQQNALELEAKTKVSNELNQLTNSSQPTVVRTTRSRQYTTC